MKVGSSLVVVLPKPLVDAFGIEKGQSIEMLATDKGIYIPLTAKKQTHDKEIEKKVKEIEK
jgi:antitoxin component of MazEF toxin-antitoxin module